MTRKALLGLIVALALPVAAFAGGDSEQAASDDGATAAEVATGQYRESPMLTQLVASGELPPVDERLPVRPLVLEPLAEAGETVGRYGGTLSVTGLDPNGDSFGAEWGDGGGFRSEGLAFFDIAFRNFTPDVAESWEVSDDYTTMTVHLREGVRWSDGELVTTEDVAFWWNDIMLNESLTAKIPNYFAPGGNVMKVNVIDDYTFSFEYAEPYLAVADQMDRLTPWSPKHYMERWHVDYNEDAAKEADAEGFGEWFEAFLARQDDRWGTVYAEERPMLGPFAPAKPDSVGNRLSPRNPFYWKVDRGYGFANGRGNLRAIIAVGGTPFPSSPFHQSLRSSIRIVNVLELMNESGGTFRGKSTDDVVESVQMRALG